MRQSQQRVIVRLLQLQRFAPLGFEGGFQVFRERLKLLVGDGKLLRFQVLRLDKTLQLLLIKRNLCFRGFQLEFKLRNCE